MPLRIRGRNPNPEEGLAEQITRLGEEDLEQEYGENEDTYIELVPVPILDEDLDIDEYEVKELAEEVLAKKLLAPASLGLGLFGAVSGLIFLLESSIVFIPMSILGAIFLWAFQNMRTKYNLRIRDVI